MGAGLLALSAGAHAADVTLRFSSAAPPSDFLAKAIETFKADIEGAGTVLWNGPMGVFENPQFAEGTLEVARALADSHATTVVGGGESVQAVEQAGLADRLAELVRGGQRAPLLAGPALCDLRVGLWRQP